MLLTREYFSHKTTGQSCILICTLHNQSWGTKCDLTFKVKGQGHSAISILELNVYNEQCITYHTTIASMPEQFVLSSLFAKLMSVKYPLNFCQIC